MKAISIKQPWASLIVHGIKDIENRSWKCPEKYIGQRVLIHSGAKIADFKINKKQFAEIEKCGYGKTFGIITSMIKSDDFNPYIYFSAIIGSVEIADCVQYHPSIWAEQWTKKDGIDIPIYNWVLANPILFPTPIPAKGKLSFWQSDVEICHICGKPTCKDNLCQRCGEYYCDDCASHYDKFSQIDYNCCSKCFDGMRDNLYWLDK